MSGCTKSSGTGPKRNLAPIPTRIKQVQNPSLKRGMRMLLAEIVNSTFGFPMQMLEIYVRIDVYKDNISMMWVYYTIILVVQNLEKLTSNASVLRTYSSFLSVLKGTFQPLPICWSKRHLISQRYFASKQWILWMMEKYLSLKQKATETWGICLKSFIWAFGLRAVVPSWIGSLGDDLSNQPIGGNFFLRLTRSWCFFQAQGKVLSWSNSFQHLEV